MEERDEARAEAEVAEAEAQVAQAEAQAARFEAQAARVEAQAARSELLTAQAEASTLWSEALQRTEELEALGELRGGLTVASAMEVALVGFGLVLGRHLLVLTLTRRPCLVYFAPAIALLCIAVEGRVDC